MQITESHRHMGVSKHRVLASLGRDDEGSREERVRGIIREYEPLKRAQVVVEEIEEVSGPLQGKGYFRKLRRWK